MRLWTLLAALAAVGTASAVSFDVAANGEGTLTDETVGSYDGASVGAGGTLYLDLSSAPPFAITGSGRVVKRNDSAWTMAVGSPSFTGTWDLSGVVTVDGPNPFGANNSNDYRVVATNNATLALAKDPTLFNMKILLGGAGYQNRGALEVASFTSTSGNCFHNLALADDATVTMKKGSLVIVSGGSINLNGHKMSLVGGGDLQLIGCSISENGEIEVSGTSAGATKLTFRSWNSTDNVAGGVTDADGMKFTLAGYASIVFFNKYKSFSRSLHVRGLQNKLIHQEQYAFGDDCCRQHVAWRGPIVFEGDDPAASVLSVSLSNATKNGVVSHCGLAIEGKISGNGSLTLWADTGSYLYVTNPANDYAGTFELTGGLLVLGHPGAIADYSKFSRTKGTVLFDADSGAWTLAAVKAFSEASAGSSSTLTFCADTNATESVASVALTDAVGFAAGKSFAAQAGTVSFVGGSTEASPLDFLWTAGRGELGGNSPYYAYQVRSNTSDAGNPATLVVNGADITLAPDGVIGSGVNASTKAVTHIGRLVVTNSIVRAADLTVRDTSTYGSVENSLAVGRGGYGTLEVEDGAVISNRLVVGSHTGSPWDGVGYGSVRQRGGKVVAVDPNGSSLKGNKIGAGQANHGGYYELQGGELISHGCFSIGQYGFGVVQVNGGLFCVTNILDSATRGALAMASGNGGKASLRVSGGTVRTCGGNDIWAGQGNTAQLHALITVDGPDAVCDFESSAVYLGYACTGGYYYLNLMDGVMRAKSFQKHSNGKVHTNNLFVVNFNGGTFRAGANAYPFNATPGYSPNHIYVYERGATIDTDGYTCWINTPIEAATEKGVKSIALTTPIAHVMPPIVEIYGSGTGATACAHYDWDRHVIDRIDVISAGCGYTEGTTMAKLKVNREDSQVLATLDAAAFELVDNVSTGAFTKAGAGVLNLAATNSWGGATVLAGGTLKCLCDRAIPQDTTVVLAGGVLDMNGMKMENGDAAPKKWRVDVATADAKGGVIPYGGTLTFVDGATLEIQNAAARGEEAQDVVLVETTGGIVGTPALVGELDPEWHVVFTGTKIKYARRRGTMLIVR